MASLSIVPAAEPNPNKDWPDDNAALLEFATDGGKKLPQNYWSLNDVFQGVQVFGGTGSGKSSGSGQALAGTLRVLFNERYVSTWLIFVSPCMTFKEGLNYWTEIRRGKIAKDLNEEAEERGNELGGGKATTEAPQAARVGQQAMKRTVVLTEEEARAVRLAEVLGIAEPYDLEEAEANFHNLIRQQHPDTQGNSPESNRRTSDLNEAIEFFREKLAG